MEYRYIFYEDVKRTQSSYTMDGWTLISKIGGYIGVNKNFLWLIVFSISSAGVLMSKFKTYKNFKTKTQLNEDIPLEMNVDV